MSDQSRQFSFFDSRGNHYLGLLLLFIGLSCGGVVTMTCGGSEEPVRGKLLTPVPGEIGRMKKPGGLVFSTDTQRNSAEWSLEPRSAKNRDGDTVPVQWEALTPQDSVDEDGNAVIKNTYSGRPIRSENRTARFRGTYNFLDPLGNEEIKEVSMDVPVFFSQTVE